MSVGRSVPKLGNRAWPDRNHWTDEQLGIHDEMPYKFVKFHWQVGVTEAEQKSDHQVHPPEGWSLEFTPDMDSYRSSNEIEIDGEECDDSDDLEEPIEYVKNSRPYVWSDWLSEEQKEKVADVMMATLCSEQQACDHLEYLNPEFGYRDFRGYKIGYILTSFETEYFPYNLSYEQRKKLAIRMYDDKLTMEQAYEKLELGKAKNSATRAQPMRVRTANKKRHKVSR
jgi:hypothetical protein